MRLLSLVTCKTSFTEHPSIVLRGQPHLLVNHRFPHQKCHKWRVLMGIPQTPSFRRTHMATFRRQMFPSKVPMADSIPTCWDENQIIFHNEVQEVYSWTRFQGLQFCFNENTRFVWKLWRKPPFPHENHHSNGFKHNFPHKDAALGGIPAEAAEVSSIWAPWQLIGNPPGTLRESNVGMEKPDIYTYIHT